MLAGFVNAGPAWDPSTQAPVMTTANP
jgi:hypothetical protein